MATFPACPSASHLRPSLPTLCPGCRPVSHLTEPSALCLQAGLPRGGLGRRAGSGGETEGRPSEAPGAAGSVGGQGLHSLPRASAPGPGWQPLSPPQPGLLASSMIFSPPEWLSLWTLVLCCPGASGMWRVGVPAVCHVLDGSVQLHPRSCPVSLVCPPALSREETEARRLRQLHTVRGHTGFQCWPVSKPASQHTPAWTSHAGASQSPRGQGERTGAAGTELCSLEEAPVPQSRGAHLARATQLPGWASEETGARGQASSPEPGALGSWLCDKRPQPGGLKGGHGVFIVLEIRVQGQGIMAPCSL